MTRSPRRTGAVLLALAAFACSSTAAAVANGRSAASPIVILVSIDGWRWDYLERIKPPTLGRLAAEGVRAEGLIPTFPSKTFPNHYTIVTGLYPARHGIISNTMWDPALPNRFSLSDRAVQQDTRWWGGERIWVAAERQGQIAATMAWPGSDAEIGGDRPTYYEPFDGTIANHDRVNKVLEWLRVSEPNRPTFLTLYFSDVDSAGHDYGPDSEELRKAALDIDSTIGRLVGGVEAAGLANRTNYVVVSDHGMAGLSRSRTIVLDDYLDLSTVDLVDTTPVVGANPRSGSAEALYLALKDKHPALHIYRSEDLPEVYRLRNHPRLPAVIGVADDGWHVTTRVALEREKNQVPGGTHGYDPQSRSMHGLFIATGPQFRSGVVVPAFENVHVYELLCRVLRLRPAMNDGDPRVAASFLK